MQFCTEAFDTRVQRLSRCVGDKGLVIVEQILLSLLDSPHEGLHARRLAFLYMVKPYMQVLPDGFLESVSLLHIRQLVLVLFLVPLAPVQLAEFLLEVKRLLQFGKLLEEDVHPLPLLIAPFVGTGSEGVERAPEEIHLRLTVLHRAGLEVFLAPFGLAPPLPALVPLWVLGPV